MDQGTTPPQPQPPVSGAPVAPVPPAPATSGNNIMSAIIALAAGIIAIIAIPFITGMTTKYGLLAIPLAVGLAGIVFGVLGYKKARGTVAGLVVVGIALSVFAAGYSTTSLIQAPLVKHRTNQALKDLQTGSSIGTPEQHADDNWGDSIDSSQKDLDELYKKYGLD